MSYPLPSALADGQNSNHFLVALATLGKRINEAKANGSIFQFYSVG